MPVDFLTPAQRERYGRYPHILSTEELARYFHLDDDDLDWIARKRRDSSRLGYALQLTTARYLGTFLDDPTDVPRTVLHALAMQLGVADPASAARSQHFGALRLGGSLPNGSAVVAPARVRHHRRVM